MKANLGTPSNEPFFESVYKHSFQLLLATPGQRSVDKASCVELWIVLFTPPSFKWGSQQVDWLKEWNDFVESPNCSIKGINRDQWNHVLKLALASMKDESLDWHNDEQSWPSIIDDFVADFRERHPKAEGEAMEF
jgi:Cullin binding